MTNGVQEQVTRVVAAVVAEASRERRGDIDMWALKLKVPFSDYPIPTSMPADWASEIFKGESYMVELRRGRRIKDDSTGTRDFLFFWNVAEWATTTPVTVPVPDSNGDDRFRTKEQLRWTEAMHMAVAYTAAPGEEGPAYSTVLEFAERFYATLEAGPQVTPAAQELMPFEPEPAQPAQAKAPKNGAKVMNCPEHKMSFDKNGRHPVFDEQSNVAGQCQREG